MKDKKSAINAVKKKYEQVWVKIDGVEGVGITEELGQKVIVVFISRPARIMDLYVPEEVEGFKVTFEYTANRRYM